MIFASKVKSNVWDFSCANDYELYKALSISCDTLDVKFIDFSRLLFGACSPDMTSVSNALSKRGIGLFYTKEKEVMVTYDKYVEKSRAPLFARSENFSEEPVMAVNEV